ncbi:uncharacterized protein [Branchiostoma lanceolatum]|uniref:uncharacterized protein isoform X1 n=1 Tax=Branchiostoma lanceolatum TaxID=7740 RepID=UPI0034568B29
MFLGLDFPAMDLPAEATYVMASWVAWQALSEIILEQETLLKCCCETAKGGVSDQEEEIEMQTRKGASSVDLNPEPKTPNPPNSGFKNGFLAIYLLVLTGFIAAMLTFIILH